MMNATKRPRVTLLQKYVAPYREPLFRAMAQSGRIDLTVMCFGAPERRRRFEHSDAAGFRQVRAAALSIRAGYERNVEIPLGLPAALARQAPAVVVCAPDWGGLAALRYCRRTGARLVVWSEATATTEAGASSAKGALRRRIYGHANGFVVPGRLARAYLESMGGRGPFFEARNSIDESNFRQRDSQILAKFSSVLPRVITFSGSLVERKGIDVLLDAFALACERHPSAAAATVLRVIGAGPRNAVRTPLANVEFTGHLGGDAYREKMHQSHVFVLPSRSDCNPLVVVESLNCGAALILSDGVGNHPEALRGNGRLVPRGDVLALADALGWAMTCSGDVLREMSQRSRAIAGEFDTARAADRFVEAVADPVERLAGARVR
jgi:glycosyltransferase involved in cell wall biosynthesis